MSERSQSDGTRWARCRAGWFGAALVLASGAAAAQDIEAGLAAFARQDYATARKHLVPAAEKGDVRALLRYAEMQLKGLGGDASPQAAVKLYEKAARAGHAEAQVALGSLHALGLGTERSYRIAYHWFIVAPVMQDGPVRREAMVSLSGVGKQVPVQPKAEISRQARDAWLK